MRKKLLAESKAERKYKDEGLAEKNFLGLLVRAALPTLTWLTQRDARLCQTLSQSIHFPL